MFPPDKLDSTPTDVFFATCSAVPGIYHDTDLLRAGLLPRPAISQLRHRLRCTLDSLHAWIASLPSGWQSDGKTTPLVALRHAVILNLHQECQLLNVSILPAGLASSAPVAQDSASSHSCSSSVSVDTASALREQEATFKHALALQVFELARDKLAQPATFPGIFIFILPVRSAADHLDPLDQEARKLRDHVKAQLIGDHGFGIVKMREVRMPDSC
ncbi:hypothetical protein CDD81_3449 [Ophiocordyceps australis]|uniref:Uncharacterized protein n=1 Tax=Ophiocordyceps australis TaxID=1399860 RepID=A0A2C5YDV2_9HYPO|nr:hypothetical protein CDD81_3449 [Ophiocordyceps australis]